MVAFEGHSAPSDVLEQNPSPPQLVHILRMKRQSLGGTAGGEGAGGPGAGGPGAGTPESGRNKSVSSSSSNVGGRSRRSGSGRKKRRRKSSSSRTNHVASLMSFNNLAHSCSVAVTSATTPSPTKARPNATGSVVPSSSTSTPPSPSSTGRRVHRDSPGRIHDAFIGVVGVPVALLHDPFVLVPEARLSTDGKGQPGSFHEYLVEYTNKTGAIESCWIRYSELRRKARELRKTSPMDFPPKAALFQSSTTDEFVERRRVDIEAWLQFEMKRSESGHSFIVALVRSSPSQPKSPTFTC